MKKNLKRHISSFLMLAIFLISFGGSTKAEEHVASYERVYPLGDRPITLASPMSNVAIYTREESRQLGRRVNPGDIAIGVINQKGEEFKINTDYEGDYIYILGCTPMSNDLGSRLRGEYAITLEKKENFLDSYLMECTELFEEGTKIEYLELNYKMERKPSYSAVVYEFRNPIEFDAKIIVPNHANYVDAVWIDDQGKSHRQELTLTPKLGEEIPKNKWIKKDGIWYYYDNMGYVKKHSWFFYNNQWYYLGAEGKMQTGWLKENNQWYYLRTEYNVPQAGSEGAMCKGWIKIKEYWYYLRPEGNVPNKGPSGSMLQNTSAVIGNKMYHFDGSGHCINP